MRSRKRQKGCKVEWCKESIEWCKEKGRKNEKTSNLPLKSNPQACWPYLGVILLLRLYGYHRYFSIGNVSYLTHFESYAMTSKA